MKHLLILTFALLSGCVSIRDSDNKSTPAPVVELIGHEDGMLVINSLIKISFRISEELNSVFVNGLLAKLAGNRYWCEVPINWEITPVVITSVYEDEISVLKKFKLRAQNGNSIMITSEKDCIFIDYPADGQVINLYR